MSRSGGIQADEVEERGSGLERASSASSRTSPSSLDTRTLPPGLLLLNPDLGWPSHYSVDLMFVRVKPGDMQEVVQYMQESWDSIVDWHCGLPLLFPAAGVWRRPTATSCAGVSSSRGLRSARCSSPLLGAFALTALAAGRRTKEIGIRKALGASVFGLTTLMTREFACLALIGALVAWPLSWWWMRDWLNGFAFRIDLAAWHFAAGAAIALVAVLLSSGHQAYKAAKADPVEALRYE